MQDLPSRKLIGVGKEKCGLYYSELMKKRGMAYSVTVKPKIWHQRLGHASSEKLRNIRLLNIKNNEPLRFLFAC